MDKFFKISENKSTVRTEIMAGLTTFFAMAYIVITNPNQIVSFNHLTPGADPKFQMIWNAVYVASILGAFIGTMLMSLYAKMPFAQACGMGLNSFFFVSFILPAIMSSGDLITGYHYGMVVIFLSGVIFFILSVTKLREKIAKALPDCLKKAIPAGIGLFIAFLGFQNVGIIKANQYTLVQFNDIHGAINGTVTDVDLTGAYVQQAVSFKDYALPALLALLGLIIIAVLDQLKVKGSVLISILAVTIIYYPIMGIAPSFDMGQVGQSFKDFGAIGITGLFDGAAWTKAFGSGASAIFTTVVLIITYALVDMFDTIGTVYGTASQAGMLDQNGDPVNLDKCMMSDSVATVVGGVSGTSTVTTFVESASGVGAGGRTGLTSLVVAICFFICLFLSPVASLVPACATAPALIYVGVLMMKNFKDVDMSEARSAVPAFLALICMPLTYSISNGIGIGAIAYTLITLFTGKYTKKDIAITVVALLFVLKFCMVTM
ncbi:MAG: NCS2 family permease [Clostridia bacterium]|nr:NCS2 family permease [Clostridia bacterium]